MRRTNNYNTQAPVTDVTGMDLRCYDTATDPSNTAETIQVRAGDQLGIQCDQTIYHPGVSEREGELPDGSMLTRKS